MPLTPEQLARAKELAQSADYPELTTDPMVNAEVDHLISGDPSWDELDEIEQDCYIREAAMVMR